LNNAVPKEPFFFLKPTSSYLSSGGKLELPIGVIAHHEGMHVQPLLNTSVTVPIFRIRQLNLAWLLAKKDGTSHNPMPIRMFLVMVSHILPGHADELLILIAFA